MSAEFVAEKGFLKGLILSLVEGNEWTIGRDPDQCDLVVEDPKVSRKHLLCQKTDDGYVLHNLSPSNPAKINDQLLLDPHLLKDEDKVLIGGTLFRFYLEGAPEYPVPSTFDESMEDELGKEAQHETIYKEDSFDEIPGIKFDLSKSQRFILKVLTGPNTGAEFALDYGRTYLIGTDTTTCDIVFYDLSVSREHARLSVSNEGILVIEDLDSRNGVVVDRDRITTKTTLSPSSVVTLGTSSFFIMDRESPTETIIASVPEPSSPSPVQERDGEAVNEDEEALVEDDTSKEAEPEVVVAKKPFMSTGALILAVILGGITILFGIGVISLFKENEVAYVPRDYEKEIQEAVAPFKGVRYTYNKNVGKLFLVGHVSTGIEKNQLLYNLQGLLFIKGLEDNIIIDDAVWQEMNLLLAPQEEFKGVTLHSPQPGHFVLSGYLETNKQYADLVDYMNLHFNFLNLLDYQVIVKEQVLDQIKSYLIENGYNSVDSVFNNGEVILTGYISSTRTADFQNAIGNLQLIKGIRSIKNYVVPLSPEQAVVDLNERYPGNYQVTGSSRHGNININVLINGRILTRGDSIDGMTITSIQPHAIFLEKDGLKYKIEYNKVNDDTCIP